MTNAHKERALKFIEFADVPPSTKATWAHIDDVMAMAKSWGYHAVSIAQLAKEIGMKPGGNFTTALWLYCAHSACRIIMVHPCKGRAFYALTDNASAVRTEMDVLS